MKHVVRERLLEYAVWDRVTRWFHWINFCAVLSLAAIGTVILFAGSLGVTDSGKVALKTVHVLVGYVFGLNLLWRVIWGFTGNRYARWKAILPFGKGYVREAREYTAGFMAGSAPGWLGHNPLGKLMVGALIIVMLAMGGTGLILAGTDIYYPPLGSTMKTWVAEDITRLDEVKPYSKTNINDARFKEMRSFRKPFIQAHGTLFYALVLLVLVHIAAAIITEIRERNGIISAMFTGWKVFDKEPVDRDR
ncbi:MAG: cytochrome b/b6 domain-containing protein [Deltaproteobacteria bacterium]|nr:cytochrome b/b6 domain-containing protein [Deltaproteobacteria bacterium]